MKYPDYRLLQILALAMVACGCAAADPRPEIASPDNVPGIASAGAGAEPSPGIKTVDPRLNLNVHVYSFSYHTDRAGVRREGLDNEFNLGFGLNYAFHEDARGIGFVEAGFYRDSGSNLAKLAGAGYQFKFGEHWRLGGALVGVYSPTYNHGRFFVAPLPIVTYDFGAVKVNATYVPRYGEYNRFAVFGFYFSIPFRN